MNSLNSINCDTKSKGGMVTRDVLCLAIDIFPDQVRKTIFTDRKGR